MNRATKLAVMTALVALIFSTWSFAEDMGADLYKAKCAACHGADGKGDTAMGKKMGLKDLGSADAQGKSDSDLNGIISNGKSPMPGYKGKLSDAQIDSLVKYIRTLKK
jgi:mono/diheme cytochrome c family protein